MEAERCRKQSAESASGPYIFVNFSMVASMREKIYYVNRRHVISLNNGETMKIMNDINTAIKQSQDLSLMTK